MISRQQGSVTRISRAYVRYTHAWRESGRCVDLATRGRNVCCVGSYETGGVGHWRRAHPRPGPFYFTAHEPLRAKRCDNDGPCVFSVGVTGLAWV